MVGLCLRKKTNYVQGSVLSAVWDSCRVSWNVSLVDKVELLHLSFSSSPFSLLSFLVSFSSCPFPLLLFLFPFSSFPPPILLLSHFLPVLILSPLSPVLSSLLFLLSLYSLISLLLLFSFLLSFRLFSSFFILLSFTYPIPAHSPTSPVSCLSIPTYGQF